MKKSKCPQCGSNTKILKQKYRSTKSHAGTNKPIIVDAHYSKCTGKGCGFTWLSADEAENIESQISRLSWNTLNTEQWAMIRDCLGFKTKTKASRFLGLNAKAFSKYERGYSEANLSIDLLARLVVHSHDNLNFIKELHRKDFKFEAKDYQIVCDMTGDDWIGSNLNSVYKNELATLQGKTNFSEITNQVPLELINFKDKNEDRYYR